MENSRPTDSLSRTLASWRVAVPRDPHFRRAVWARVGAGSAALPWAAYAQRHAAVLGGALVLAMAAGALTGHERARSRVAADAARLAAAYVQEYDGRVQAGR